MAIEQERVIPGIAKLAVIAEKVRAGEPVTPTAHDTRGYLLDNNAVLGAVRRNALRVAKRGN